MKTTNIVENNNDIEIFSQPTTEKIKPLIKYEFAGGKYPVLILLTSLLFIGLVILFSLLCTMPDNYFLFTVTGISKIVYHLISFAGIVACVSSIVFYLATYFKYRGTKFKIYENGISGTGFVKGMSNGIVDFELDFREIDVISLNFGYVSIASNGMIFNFMITSKDFNRNLRKVLEEHKNIRKNVFKTC